MNKIYLGFAGKENLRLGESLVLMKKMCDILRSLNISMDEIISPDTVKVVKNEGMPIIDEEKPIESITLENKKGDLYIKFDISKNK